MKRIRKEAVLAYSELLPKICLEGLRKTAVKPVIVYFIFYINSAYGFSAERH
jgi:hypothetical protein